MLRYLIAGVTRGRTVIRKQLTPLKIQKFGSHDDYPPQPFDNMPFKINNRYFTTMFFSVFFGIGLWAPFFIVWYQMAKSSL